MTQTNQRQQTPPNAIPTSPTGVLMSAAQSSKPAADSISDNDTSEKPVREKLKKTSLASMSSHIVGRQERPPKVYEDKPAPHHMHRDSSPENCVEKKAVESRGRPVKKRSFDDLDTPEAESIEAGRELVENLNASGHLRKRSRDVRVGEAPTENRRPLFPGTPVREESEDAENGIETREAYVNGYSSAMNSIAPALETLTQQETDQETELEEQFRDVNEPSKSVFGKLQNDYVNETEKDLADHEMRDSAFNPQKKRSRDQFDTEADRELKIPATEEAKAHRRSDELERGEVSAPRIQSPVLLEGSGAVGEELVTVEEDAGLVPVHDSERPERPLRSAFGSASTFSPSMTLARGDSSVKSSTLTAKANDQQSQTSADAFATSGFAALAGASTSPFGILGGSSTAAGASPFVSPGVLNSGKTETYKHEAGKAEANFNGGFSTFVNSPSSGLGKVDQSPFGSSGPSKSGVFGRSVFGSAFGGPLAGGNRLTSFAAPTGDTKLGVSNGTSKPIGSPKRDEDENENSESEGERAAESKRDEEAEDADGRFQHQNVETGEGGEDSIFSSRASLYSFRDNAWKESGKGIFKLNIAPASPEDASSDRKTGRFIMRAHQTYRVLLNVPVFKQMQIGDSKGDEPAGKSFLFAVIENAKPVAHMLKLGDVADSKTLYHEVRRLQNGLE